MPNLQAPVRASATITCRTLKPARTVPDMIDDARRGLLMPPRSLPPKYFYDARGSDLFERITYTEDYYPTRYEDELLTRHAREILQITKPAQILELGSGSSRKTRRLFDACETLQLHCDYAPMDVCEAALLQAAEELIADYHWLQVNPIVGDYHAGLAHLPEFNGRRLFAFLGSTIGNFEPETARQFLNEVRQNMRAGDSLLLGADRVKDPAVLETAYNDREGLTAAFNLNVLEVLNRELDADFIIENFTHRAHYNADRQRIEMRLHADNAQHVRLGRLDTSIHIDADESILTELSHKFTGESLQTLLNDSGLSIQKHFQANDGYFSLLLAHKQF